MKQGKLTNKQLKTMIIDKLNFKRKEVIVGSNVGEDCAIMDFGGEYISASTDPITAATANAGYLAMVVNANDVAASGATPVCALVTLMVPPTTVNFEIEKLINQIIEGGEKLGIQIAGGHTEVTDAVKKPVICTTMLGKTTKILSVKNICPGDTLIMTKHIAMEGSHIVVSDMKDKIANLLSKSEIQDVMGFELCVVNDAKLLMSAGNVVAMHDVTEGGILGGIHEFCEGAGVGVHIDMDKISIHPATKKICDKLDINPYRFISSGCLIAAIRGNGERETALLKSNGIECRVIGEFNGTDKVTAEKNGNRVTINPPGRDEIYKL